MPVAKSGYSYLLTIIDHASRWLEVVPLTNIRAETCAVAFLNGWVYRYGPPRVLHSDRGTQFLSNIFEELRKKFVLVKSFTTPYHPQGNSIVERVHRTLKDRLRATGGSWLDNIHGAVYNVNRMCSVGEGPSAYEVIFGKFARLPSDWSSDSESVSHHFYGPAVAKKILYQMEVWSQDLKVDFKF